MESGMESGPLWAQRHMNSYVIWDHMGPKSYGPKSLYIYIYICAHVFFFQRTTDVCCFFLLLFPPVFPPVLTPRSWVNYKLPY